MSESKTKKKVVILGGGVAGMTAAHELLERGFAVDIYEMRRKPGGKARSTIRKDGVPGEHGFRFFPRFYKHIDDTMKRIDLYDEKENPTGKTVFNNLVDTITAKITTSTKPIIAPVRFPKSWKEVKEFLDIGDQLVNRPSELGLTDEEVQFFAQKVWRLITSCDERRATEYERIGWWEYLEADRYSDAYKNLFVKGLTRSLVASKAELANTRTVGNIFLQLMFDALLPGASTDRVLNGPTSEVWFNPWKKYLKNKFGQDFKFYQSHQVIKVLPPDKTPSKNGGIEGVIVRNLDPKNESDRAKICVTDGDYYIMALPVEVLTELLTDEITEADPALKSIKKLSLCTAWMNGIQFYLKKDVPIDDGHALYADSPWALTSISQRQFWKDSDWSFEKQEIFKKKGIEGILSVCISDWGSYLDLETGKPRNPDEFSGTKDSKGSNGKYAYECTNEEIKEEVWNQLKKSLNANGTEILKDELLDSYFLDSDIFNYQDGNEPHNYDSNDEEAVIRKNTIVSPQLLTKLREICERARKKGYFTLTELIEPDKPGEDSEEAILDLIRPLLVKGFVRKESSGEDHEERYVTSITITGNKNLEPLLVSLVGTRYLRPEAFTRIPNLFLASDYVQTNTDLATMEGANEAARRAVNAIIDAAGVKKPRCKIWKHNEPFIFALWKWNDYKDFEKGVPWKQEFPSWLFQISKQLIRILITFLGSNNNQKK
jgi:uncharacterized protein with NAD-binding domain and iron-sulfur cluster